MSDFVICTDNGSNPARLILGKFHRRPSDAEAEPRAPVPSPSGRGLR